MVKRNLFKLFIEIMALVMLSSCGEMPTQTQEPPIFTDSDIETEPNTPVVYDDSYTREVLEVYSSVTERTTRPTDFSSGKTYDDLIFYEPETASNEQKLSTLPKGTVLLNQKDVLSHGADLRNTYGFAEAVEIDDSTEPFANILRVTVNERPDTPYSFQLALGSDALRGNVAKGSVILVSFYARCTAGESGEIGFVIEEDGSKGTYNKLISVTAKLDGEWQQFFYPTVYSTEYTSVNIRFGYCEQILEIGEFSIVDYGTSVTYEDMPRSGENPDFAKDAAWREEAFARIQEIRKGDINITVTDADGNPIEGAKVELQMFEHEFEWGVAVSQGDTNNADEMAKIARLFNAAVPENELKWSRYEASPEVPKRMIAALVEVGINTVRGHCLVWDRDRRQNDTSVPADLPSLYDDREALTERIRTHIEEAMADMAEGIDEWDVLNEACTNTTMQDIYGRELIAEWFAMARATGVDANLYYNDYVMSEELFELLDLMEDMGVDYDGIGVQSHYSSAKSMEDILAFYRRLAEYGKKIKITEYDFACLDEQLQASFTRDILILSFSIEQIEGFYLWGMSGGEGERYVCYDSLGNPRLALEQIEDLIYNKWWTEEEGRTDKNGEACFSGFYGSYYISVIANGVKKTVSVDCFGGQPNDIQIVMPTGDHL